MGQDKAIVAAVRTTPETVRLSGSPGAASVDVGLRSQEAGLGSSIGVLQATAIRPSEMVHDVVIFKGFLHE